MIILIISKIVIFILKQKLQKMYTYIYYFIQRIIFINTYIYTFNNTFITILQTAIYRRQFLSKQKSLHVICILFKGKVYLYFVQIEIISLLNIYLLYRKINCSSSSFVQVFCNEDI
mgnify:CR=1 FL=1